MWATGRCGRCGYHGFVRETVWMNGKEQKRFCGDCYRELIGVQDGEVEKDDEIL